jgi:hypothetical protein
MVPLQIVAKDNPATCAVYAKDNGLLDTPGWRILSLCMIVSAEDA